MEKETHKEEDTRWGGGGRSVSSASCLLCLPTTYALSETGRKRRKKPKQSIRRVAALVFSRALDSQSVPHSAAGRGRQSSAPVALGLM